MSLNRSDVVAQALELLEAGGLADVTMRRVAADLGVQPSALYYHVPNKQTLLAMMADELLARVAWPGRGEWADQVALTCELLHEAVLTVRDGAELVATVWSFGLGASTPYDVLVAHLDGFGALAPAAARTLLHYVYGHATFEQTRAQAADLGAIQSAESVTDFGTGLGIVIAGIQVMHAAIEPAGGSR